MSHGRHLHGAVRGFCWPHILGRYASVQRCSSKLNVITFAWVIPNPETRNAKPKIVIITTC